MIHFVPLTLSIVVFQGMSYSIALACLHVFPLGAPCPSSHRPTYTPKPTLPTAVTTGGTGQCTRYDFHLPQRCLKNSVLNPACPPRVGFSTRPIVSYVPGAPRITSTMTQWTNCSAAEEEWPVLSSFSVLSFPPPHCSGLRALLPFVSPVCVFSYGNPFTLFSKDELDIGRRRGLLDAGLGNLRLRQLLLSMLGGVRR